MELLYLILAMALPWVLGTTWLRLLAPVAFCGRQPLLAGYGLFLGLLTIPILMRLIDALGMPITFTYVSSATGLCIIGGLVLNIHQSNKAIRTASECLSLNPLSNWQKALFTLLCAVIGLRLITLGLELIWRPLFPWDASMHWATKAKVWFDSYSMNTFIDNDLWLKTRDASIFTDHHPEYPRTIPLLQVWINSAIGHWDTSLMNLPWLLCYISLGLMFYGQARASGVSIIVAIVFTYFLLSLPLLDTHVALAGYADLFLGTCYAGAIMAFHNWSQGRKPWQGFLALILALSCLLIKNEGFYWLLTFIPALLVVLLRARIAVTILLALALVIVAGLWFFPGDITVAGHSLDRLNLHYRPKALPAIISSFTTHGSWHLFAYLLIFIIPVGYVLAGHSRRAYLGIGTALASAVGLFFILFLFTKYAGGAVRFTAVGRIALQLVPSLMFLIMLLYNEISRIGGDHSGCMTRNPNHGQQDGSTNRSA